MIPADMLDTIALAASWLAASWPGQDTVPTPETYAGAFFAIPILLGILVLCVVAFFACLVVLFGFLGETPAIAAAFVCVGVATAALPGLVRGARRILPGPLMIRLRGPLGWEPFPEQVGAKAAHLASLMARGENVPAALVLGSRFFHRVMRNTGLDGVAPEDRSDAVRCSPWSTGTRRLLRRALRSIGPENLIVRSSFSDEDGTEACSAGVYVSVPDVDAGDPAAVEAALREVYASYWSHKARAYRAAMGLAELPHPRLAVILQRQVPHDLQGHAASLDPATGRDDHVRVEARDRHGRSAGWLLDAGSGGQRSFVGDAELRPPADRLGPALLSAVRQAEDCLGTPVEIEWGLAGEQLCLYQARPSVKPSPHLVYSNGTYGEAIPRVLTPLSESVLIEGLGWIDLLANRLARLGLPAPAPPAVRHRGRWYLLEAPWRRLQLGPVGVSVQLRLVREAVRAAWSGRRVLARCDEALAAAERTGGDSRPLIDILGRLVDLNHSAGLASDALRRTAEVLGGSSLAFGGVEVGNRRAMLLEALRSAPRPGLDELVERFGDLADDDLELRTPRYREVADHCFAPIEQGVGPTAFRGAGAPPGKPPRPLARIFSRAALGFARLRERCRDRIDRANAILRTRALAFQRQSWDVPPIPDAVFFMRTSEWVSALEGGPLPIPDTLRARAEAWRDERGAGAAERILVGPDGTVVDDQLRGSSDGAIVEGLGASPGSCTGPTLKLPAEQPVAGTVVLLPDADGRWLRHLLGASAVVLRSGGILSHLAMVIRDLGVPCVVTPGIDLPNGTVVTVDGDRGWVLVHREQGDGGAAPPGSP